MEEKYIVFKIQDALDYLNPIEQEELQRIAKKIVMWRKFEDREEVKGLFIREHLPIYEEVEEILINYIAEENANAN